MSVDPASANASASAVAAAAAAANASGWRSGTVRAMAWMAAGGLSLSLMNAIVRVMTLELDPFQAQFLRYLCGLFVMLPLILRRGWSRYRPNRLVGQLWRGIVHTIALSLFFVALPHIPLADMTAIMFTTPIFVLVGAALVLREKVGAARWSASLVGFGGVIVVLWPHLAGGGAGRWSLVMLSATPFFAASFLIAKSLTRHDSAETIVTWQNVTVTLFTLPLALLAWQTPTMSQWGISLVCGLLGSVAYYCMTRAFALGDISAVQSVRFLDLIWSSLLGLAIFGNSPSITALAGGAVIVAATVWIARREAGRASIAASGKA